MAHFEVAVTSGLLHASVPLLIAFVYFLLEPLAKYLYDANGFRKYPNQNLISGITNVGYMYEVRKGLRTKRLYEAHKKNPIIRLGPKWLSFADVNAIRDIYGYSTTCIKGDMYKAAAGSHHHLVDVVDKAEHSRKRRILANAYAPKHIAQWEPKVADKTAKLLVQFDKRCTRPPSSIDEEPRPEDLLVDFRKWIHLLTIESIADIGLSDDLGLLDAGDDTLLVEGLDGTKRQVHFINSLYGGHRAASVVIWSTQWFPFLKRLTGAMSHRFKEQWQDGANWGQIIHHLVRKRIERHRNGEQLDDFFTCLLEDKRGGSRDLDVGEMEAETNIMMNAGSDGTAISLANTVYYLIKDPTKMVKLRAELDSALSKDDVIAPWSKVKHLPYLTACIDESLRLSPPVATGLVRKTPAEGTTILGQFIPGGTSVSMPAYIAHRDPAIFPQPEEYKPERWLEDNVKNMQSVFMPFSTGARGCIGRNVSMLEQNVVLATLVHRYDFALPRRDWETDWEEAFNLWPGKMPIKIWKRDSVGVV